MPPGLAGVVGGARATIAFPKPAGAGPIAAATTGVDALRICVQVWPPSLVLNTPRPEIPAYNLRAPAGEVPSITNERTSPNPLAPSVQFWPPSVDRNTPLVDAR